MVWGLFTKKDPVCGMKEKKGTGIEKAGNWFCSERCEKEFSKKQGAHQSHGYCP